MSHWAQVFRTAYSETTLDLQNGEVKVNVLGSHMKKELLYPQDQYLTQAINVTGFCIQVEKSPLTMRVGTRLANSSMYNNEAIFMCA